ncbi:hypothetical protein J3E72DRAFT_303511 [Bipolaris maydis]|nr:hypothetical protein J3E73DRAFT_289454 [Bipolaris maydis]KAJ5063202.1 hypothetical protein J3E74DRAFT_316456 [Bipolaris maydis]KAJ6199467.1 hypothetical protein J3E72DRAFT_303511 [Bipolaris maydis]KAJ6272604.1 hypothetical protein PSV08DRAFT_280710 [Bipolaris maydis]
MCVMIIMTIITVLNLSMCVYMCMFPDNTNTEKPIPSNRPKPKPKPKRKRKVFNQEQTKKRIRKYSKTLALYPTKYQLQKGTL